MSNGIASCLYTGTVTHQRKIPFGHRLAYRIYAMLLDLDELPHLDTGSVWFGYNRFALLSHYDRDHGARDGSALRGWVAAELAKAGLSAAAHTLRILCFPRVLGYAFNPISVIFGYAADGQLGAILYEVKNTFGEQHGYLFPILAPAPIQSHECAKVFHVSPFIGMQADYHFRIAPPGSRFSLTIDEATGDGHLLNASWTGLRQGWTPANLRRCFFQYPLLTFKVIGGIHWQALKIWLKGGKYHVRPIKPAQDVTYAAAGPNRPVS